MQFGMPTLLEAKTPEASALLCHELGLSFIELNMNLPEYQNDQLDIERLNDIAKRYNLYYTMHLDDQLNPFDLNDRVAMAYTETVLFMVEAAKRLSVPMITMHLPMGVCFTLPHKKVYLFDEYENEYLRKLADFIEKCVMVIGNENITICIENCDGFDRAPFLQKSLDLLLECPSFALTFDIGHSAAAKCDDESVIAEHLDKLRHMHMHDALGNKNHLILGEGILDITKYLALAQEQDCRVVLEVKTVNGLRKSIEWLRKGGWLDWLG